MFEYEMNGYDLGFCFGKKYVCHCVSSYHPTNSLAVTNNLHTANLYINICAGSIGNVNYTDIKYEICGGNVLCCPVKAFVVASLLRSIYVMNSPAIIIILLAASICQVTHT